jgi:hypothetical protein
MDQVSTVWRPARPAVRLVILTITTLLALTPALAHAQGATPTGTSEPSAIETMFARVPAAFHELDNPASAMIAFADISAQLEAVGITPPPSMDDPGYDAWLAAARVLALPVSASPFGTYTREDYGFDLLQADRTLSIMLPPFHLTLLQGAFHLDAVRQTLDTAGYRPTEVGGHTLLSLRGDFEVDVGAPPAFRMAAMNFATILEDGTLAFASAGAPLAAVLDVAAGTAPSMLDDAAVGLLLAQAPPDLASAMLVSGLSLTGTVTNSMIDEILTGGTPDIDALATEIAATSEMPPVVMALLGSTVGGPLATDATPVAGPATVPTARAVAVVLLLAPEAARTAVPIVEERLATGQSARDEQPYATMFPERTVEAVDGMPVLRVDLTLGEGVRPLVLVNLLYDRDLQFLAW